MHTATFTFKRAHLCSEALGRRAVARVADMTPARFDLMYLIRRRGCLTVPHKRRIRPSKKLRTKNIWKGRLIRIGRFLRQSDLRWALGIHHSTLSKMLSRLAALGWVEIVKDTGDRRTNDVWLTPLGISKIEKAMRHVFKRRTVLRAFENIYKYVYMKRGWDVLHAIERLDAEVRTIARCLGDVAVEPYWYGMPEDH